MKKMKEMKEIFILEEIARKESKTNEYQVLHPIIRIYETGNINNRMREVMDYLWFDEKPSRFENYSLLDFYRR